MLSALPSGNSMGGTVWKIEYNKQNIMYGLDINDKPLNITHPMKNEDFKNAFILITNSYITPLKGPSSKIYTFVSQEKLRLRLEKVFVEGVAQVLMPCTSKNGIL